jgi:hypothetical protein
VIFTKEKGSIETKRIKNNFSEISNGDAEMLIWVETVTICTEIFVSTIPVHVKCHPVVSNNS